MSETPPQREGTPLQRAEGVIKLSTQLSGQRTRVKHLHQGGCSRVLFPKKEAHHCEAVMVNISGGLAAGDRLQTDITCEEHAKLVMSSQGHERVYRARPEDAPAQIDIHCRLAPHASLEWLPHGTIFFENSQLVRRMRVDMAPTARCLFYESRILGRHGSHEHLQKVHIEDRLSIYRDGKPLLIESTKLIGADIQSFLVKAPISAGAYIDTTLVLVDEKAESLLPDIRSLLAEKGDDIYFAASYWEGKLVVCGLAHSNWAVESLMHQLLPLLRDGKPMPTGWRI